MKKHEGITALCRGNIARSRGKGWRKGQRARAEKEESF